MWLSGKESASNAGDLGLIPGGGGGVGGHNVKISWRREWPPTPVFLPGKSNGQRSLVGYGLWGRKESDMIEQLTLFLLAFA